MNKLSINVTANAKSLSSFSGLHLFTSLIGKFEWQQSLASLLPTKCRERGYSSWNKFYAGILGFIAGAECLDDFELIGQDPLIAKIATMPSPVTLGKFLRSFKIRQIEELRNLLPRLAFKMRLWLQPKVYKIVFKMDGTLHEQYGRQEGVEFNYKNFKSLSSQNLFDDKGLCYGFALRAGATHSSVGAVEMMENAFQVIPRSIQKFYVADSAYANTDVYNCLLNHNVNFAICLPELVWRSLLSKYGNKISWVKSRLKFFDSDKCEVGGILYPKKGLALGRGFLRVVFIRSKKKEIKAGDNHPYHYYAIVTNMSESEMRNEDVLRFYRSRSQVENYIKDLKGGMDFYHFPCHSLKANHVWGLMGILAYNLMRMASFTLNPTGCFVKTTRRKLVTLAGEVISHARSIEVRMMGYLAKEVNRLRMILCSSFLGVDVSRFAPLLE